MNYSNHLNGMIPIGKLRFAIVVEDDFDCGHPPNVESDGSEYFANEECVMKMRQPVACNDFSSLHTMDARTTFVSLCWYFEPVEVEQNDYWNETAIRKMREPIVHGTPIFLTREGLERLAAAL